VQFPYILRCSDGSFYVGHTDNLRDRLERHNEGTASLFTRARRPVEMIYAESFTSRDAAIKRERQVKHWKRAKKSALLAGDLNRLKRL
jgi:predicted GIY-YIG superfamily endonuclease